MGEPGDKQGRVQVLLLLRWPAPCWDRDGKAVLNGKAGGPRWKNTPLLCGDKDFLPCTQVTARLLLLLWEDAPALVPTETLRDRWWLLL